MATENTILSTDIEPGISIDFTTRISNNIKSLMAILDITELEPMASGNQIKLYTMSKTNTPSQVAEGEVIPLTKIDRKLAKTIELTLKKYRKNTTAEAIQRVGRDLAVNATDEKMILEVQKDIKSAFYTALGTGTGTAEGTNLQTVLANLWAALQTRYDDMDVSPVYFIHPNDAADYLGNAQVTMQTAFGFTYVENFLGLGTAIITPKVTEGSPVATAKENINGAYVPAGGDVAQTFNLTFDSTGLVGMTHQVQTSNASVDTLMFSGVVFFPEYVDGVFKGTITPTV